MTHIAAFGSDDLAEAIVQTIDQPLLILRADLKIEEANSAFCDLFKVSMEDVRGCFLYEVGNGQWNVPQLRQLLEQVLPQRSTVRGYRIEQDFPHIGKRVMILNAKRIPGVGGRPDLILLVVSDHTEVEQARLELEGHLEFETKLIDSVREALLVLDWDLRVVRANQPFYDTFHVSASDTKGRLVYEIGNGQWNVPRLRELLEVVLPDDNRFDDVYIEHDFEVIGRRVMVLNGRRLDHLDLIVLAIRDVTDQRQMEERQRTLMGELHHRISNLLNSVSALVNQTLRDAQSLDAFEAALHARLAGLARTQELLVRAPSHPVGLAEILRVELTAQGGIEGTSFSITGPDVALLPEALQSFAMAVHELTTNAVKYGALAAPDGMVRIVWQARVEGRDTTVMFRWREHGVEIDPHPARTGYGSRLLNSVFRHSLQGSCQLTLHPDGAEFVAEFLLK